MGERFTPGRPTFITSDSPKKAYSTVFEDDGETGYFYAWDQRPMEGQILDAVHIYNVSAVMDSHFESVLEILWSNDGLKSALLINGHPHAVFDFAAKRGYCRMDFPNSSPKDRGGWQTDTHGWDEAVMQYFQITK